MGLFAQVLYLCSLVSVQHRLAEMALVIRLLQNALISKRTYFPVGRVQRSPADTVRL